MVVQRRSTVLAGQGSQAPEDDQPDGRHATTGWTVVADTRIAMMWVPQHAYSRSSCPVPSFARFDPPTNGNQLNVFSRHLDRGSCATQSALLLVG